MRHPPRSRGRTLAPWRLPLTALTLALLGGAGPALPPIVFVSRQPVPGEPGAIPGLGPHHRALAVGGRLLVREPDGRVRDLLRDGALFDVSDPSVSFDGRRVAFAGTPHADSAWRIYVVGLDGRGLARVTAPPARLDAGLPASLARADDLDPCWIGERSLCFASTRYPQRAEYADLPVTNLYRIDLDAPERPPMRLTAERNGAEEPCFDPGTGRVLFARWWFNRQRASRGASGGFTTDPRQAALPDSANLWQPMEAWPDGSDERLAAGELRTRRGSMGYQPAVLRDGTRVGVYAANLGLSPRAGGAGIQSFPHGFGTARHLAGAIVADAEGDVYSAARGLAPPSACAPAGLPDGGLVFAYDPGARGDFGLYVMRRDGGGLTPLLDRPGTLELDPAPVVVRRAASNAPIGAPSALAERPPRDPGDLEGRGTFRYLCLNVFAAGPIGSPDGVPPPPTAGARVRFFAALSRPDREGGDTIVLVREAPVRSDGSVDQRLPADTPLFEQVTDREGRVLLSAHGAAHVAGFNAGRRGGESRCAGCHVGHSVLVRASGAAGFEWFDAAPGAAVRASSDPGSARAAADHRVDDRSGWLPAGPGPDTLSLRWGAEIEARHVLLRGMPAGSGERAGAGPRTEIVLYRGGREALRRPVPPWRDRGSVRVSFGPVTIDSLDLIVAAPGRRVGLAEIEVEGRLAPP